MTGPALSSQPRTVQEYGSCALQAQVVGAGVHFLTTGQTSVALAASASAGHPGRIFHVVTADWEVYGKELGFSLAFRMMVAGVAPAVSVYLSLWRVTALAGAGPNPTMSVGAEVAGSRTATRLLNVAGEVTPVDASGPFEIDPTGFYAVGCNFSAAMAANSVIGFNGRVSCASR